MKRVAVLFFLVMVGFVPSMTAQEQGKKTTSRSTTKKAIPGPGNTDAVRLSVQDSSQAFGSSNGRLTIADPTINALNDQAAGNTTFVSPSGIVGMPKRAYGFYNGKLLLRKTIALSSGTVYGSGAVGTGTSITGVGAGENAIGVNGKNPYAGTSLWGSRIPVRNLPVTDSSRQQR